MRAFAIAWLALLLAGGVASAQPVRTAVGPRTNLSKPFRRFLETYDRDAAIGRLPADAKANRYVLVKGLFGNHYPGYMSKNITALKDAGLSAEFAPINTAGSVSENADVIEHMIRTTDRPIVFIGHSKGVPDIVEAVTRIQKTDPALVKRNVRGLLSLQGAYRGSPVADLLASHPIGRAAVRGVTKLLGGSPDSVMDLRTHVRHDAVEAAPMPTDVVPTVSMVGYGRNYRSLLGPGVALLKMGFGMYSDGLVPTRSALIDGSDVVRMPVDHAKAAFGRHSERVTLGLLNHLLRAPYSKE